MGKIEDKDIDLRIDRETLLQEYIPKDQYEARLKADMIGILKEIQMEFEEKIQGYEARSLKHINEAYEASMSGRMFGYCGANEIIQEKIDKLRGEENEHI